MQVLGFCISVAPKRLSLQWDTAWSCWPVSFSVCDACHRSLSSGHYIILASQEGNFFQHNNLGQRGRVKKTELKLMVFCNTATLALTNKHDTVVGSSPCANHSTLTDGCWDDIKHPTPPLLDSSPVFAHRLLRFSPARRIFFLLFHTSLFFQLFSPSCCCEYPSLLIFWPYLTYCSTAVSSFLIFFFFPLTCSFILPHLQTHDSSFSLGPWFNKKVENEASKVVCSSAVLQDCITLVHCLDR